MGEWMKQGCSSCRQGVLSGMYSPSAAEWQGVAVMPPSYVGTSDAEHAHLYKCQECGAWWRFNEREAHVIAEEEVKSVFPELARL